MVKSSRKLNNSVMKESMRESKRMKESKGDKLVKAKSRVLDEEIGSMLKS